MLVSVGLKSPLEDERQSHRSKMCIALKRKNNENKMFVLFFAGPIQMVNVDRRKEKGVCV